MLQTGMLADAAMETFSLVRECADLSAWGVRVLSSLWGGFWISWGVSRCARAVCAVLVRYAACVCLILLR